MKRILSVLLCVLVFMSAVSLPASAATMIPYLGYEYNTEDESVPAPVGYEPVSSVLGQDIDAGIGALSTPADLCFFNDELYILDSGNSRIVITDAELNFKRVIQQIPFNGELLDYKGAQGLYICHDGQILIADTANQRIIECDPSGNGVKLFTKPDV